VNKSNGNICSTATYLNKRMALYSLEDSLAPLQSIPQRAFKMASSELNKLYGDFL
jgi:hypothetical protein